MYVKCNILYFSYRTCSKCSPFSSAHKAILGTKFSRTFDIVKDVIFSLAVCIF